MRLLPWIGIALAGALPAQSPPAPASTDPAAVVPIAAFAELPLLESPKLSPDGTRVLAKGAVGGRQVLLLTSLVDARERHTLGAPENTDINWWRWVNDGWLLIGLGAQQDYFGTEIYVTRVLAVSTDMKTTRRLDWTGSGMRADDVLWVAHDGSPRILLSRQTGMSSEAEFYPSVFEIDVSTGKSRRVAEGRPNVYSWYADGEGQVRAAYQYNDSSRSSALLYRANNRESFRTIARRARKDEDGMTIPLTFRTDGSAVAFDDEDGFTAVYEVSLPDLRLGKKLYALEGYDVDAIIDNADENDVIGASVTGQFGRSVWFDERLKELQKAIDGSIGDRRARIVS